MNMLNLKNLIAGLLLGAMSLAPAWAQNDAPKGPLTIIVPFGAGNGLDVMARSYGVQLGQQMHVPVVVDNREGAGGLIGTMATARSAPNGQTIMFTAEYPFLTTPSMQAGQTYDPVTGFTPIAKVASSPHVVVVSGTSTLKTMDDLAKFAKANPGKLRFASSGIGTPSHLYMERLLKDAGIPATHVPYKSTGTATTDVISGQVQLYMPSLSAVMPFLRDGKLRALAVGSSKRMDKMPEVPTLAEVLRKPGLDAYVWFGFLAPKGVPQATVERLQHEIELATKSSNVSAIFAQLDADFAPAGAQRFAQEIRTGSERAQKLLTSAGVEAK